MLTIRLFRQTEGLEFSLKSFEAVAKLQFRRQAGTDRGPFQSRTKVPPDGRNFLPPEVKNPALSLRGFSAALRGYTLPVFMNLQSKFYLTRAAARYDKIGSIPTFLTN